MGELSERGVLGNRPTKRGGGAKLETGVLFCLLRQHCHVGIGGFELSITWWHDCALKVRELDGNQSGDGRPRARRKTVEVGRGGLTVLTT